jgi:hypothetical protein
MNAERIEQARRFGGELCDIDGCTEYGTLEHVTAHLAAAETHAGSDRTHAGYCSRCRANPRSNR